MHKNLKILFVILLVVIGLLATSTGYFYAKTKSLSGTKEKSDDTQNEDMTADDTEKPTTNTATQTSEVTTPAPLNNRPSSPSDTVKVQEGETLFSIGQTNDVSWTVLAEVNGIDPDKIQAGETIIIPKNNQVNYTVNQEKAESLQKDVDSGKYAFRLLPLETAKSDAPSVYGITTTDNFELKSDTQETATVIVTHENKKYEIRLIQPVTKGEKGIWAIESIKPQAS